MENDAHNKPDDFSEKIQVVSGKIPFLNGLLADIDSRQLFSQGMTQALRLISVFGSIVIGGGCLLSAFKVFSMEGRDGHIQVFAALTILAVAVVSIIGMMVIGRRSDQLLNKGIDSVLEIFLFLVRIIAELAALVAFAVMFCWGMNTLLLGDDANKIVNVALAAVMMVVNDFSGTGTGGEGAGLGVRVLGLGRIIASFIIGYFVLFVIYVIHDFLDIVYRFFNRGNPTDVG